MKYKVLIEETISQEFEIEADGECAAIEKAINDYYDEKIVLDNPNLVGKNISIADKDGQYNEFDSF